MEEATPAAWTGENLANECEDKQPTNMPELTTHTIPNVIAGELTQVEKGEEHTLNLYARKETAHAKRERNHRPHSVGIHNTQMNRRAQPSWFSDEPQGKTTTIFDKFRIVKEDIVNNAWGRLQPIISGQNNSAHGPIYMGKANATP